MKLVFNKWSFSLLLVGLMVLNLTASGKQEFSKTIKKEFEISPDGTTSIHNKYGKIDMKTWDKNRVKVDVTIMVRANSEADAQEVFERIAINFENGRDYVKAQTEIEAQKKSNWWGDENKSDYTINYEVFMPSTNSVGLTNKYGDTKVAAIQGGADLDIKYGNFELEGVQGETNLTFAYGTGTFNTIKDATAEVRYARLVFKQANQLELISKYSKITIEKANEVRSSSKYDTYTVGKVQNFHNSGKYDNLEIGDVENLIVNSQYTEIYSENISNSVDLDLEYGRANVEKIAKGFSDVRLVGRYTDYKVNVEDGANYRMEAVANYAGIKYPKRMTVTYEKEKGTYHEVEGHAGVKNARSFIKARLDYGGLKVNQ
jgi:hypothetical protein